MQLSTVILLLALVAMTTANRSCLVGQYDNDEGNSWAHYKDCEDGVYLCNMMEFYKGADYYITWGCGECSFDENMDVINCHECEYDYCNQGDDGDDGGHDNGAGKLGLSAAAILVPAIFLQ